MGLFLESSIAPRLPYTMLLMSRRQQTQQPRPQAHAIWETMGALGALVYRLRIHHFYSNWSAWSVQRLGYVMVAFCCDRWSLSLVPVSPLLPNIASKSRESYIMDDR